MPKLDRPRAQDAPRWRCDECGVYGNQTAGDLRCYGCNSGTLHPAPSLAVERCERVVVRAALAWDMDCLADGRLLGEIKKLRAAHARAAQARSRKP